jgi:hypothetical protein
VDVDTGRNSGFPGVFRQRHQSEPTQSLRGIRVKRPHRFRCFNTLLIPALSRRRRASACKASGAWARNGSGAEGSNRGTIGRSRQAKGTRRQRRGQAAAAENDPGHDATRRETSERETRDSHPAAHVLFAPGDARRTGAGHPGTRRSPGPGDDAALPALGSGAENSVLTVLNVLMRTAVEWSVIDRVPCAIKMLRHVENRRAFCKFEQFASGSSRHRLGTR